jgi:hypothetical protein
MPTSAQELFHDPAFGRELGADPELLGHFIDGLSREADENTDALGVWDALQWIARQRRTNAEKALAVTKLLGLPRGRVFIRSARGFFGWV